jgi:folate-dependent tRNA-U54 methylase TrmFO/GidA
MNSKEFSIEIEKLVKEHKDMTYIDAVVHYCEKNELDVGTVNPLVSKTLKQKIELEAQALNYLPKTGVLPI